MKFFARKQSQRLTNYALAALLVFSTITASVPYLFSETANAATNVICTGGCNSTQINAAITNAAAGDTLSLDGNVTLTQKMLINKQLTILGNNHSVIASSSSISGEAISLFGANGVVISDLFVKGNGSTNLHGINAFKGSSVLDSVSISGFTKYGLLVNGSNVTVDSISTSANGWGGVDVNQSSTSNPSTLTVNGTSLHTDIGNASFIGVKHLFIDNATKPVSIVDTNNQYTVSTFGNARFYELTPAPAAPANLRFAEFACGGATNINSISPTWDAVPGATSYNYRVTLPNGSVYGPVSKGNVTSILNGQFGATGISTFAVQAVGSNGMTSAWSAGCSVNYDVVAPVAPVTQGPNGWTNGASAFSWSTPADTGSALTYEVQYSRTHPNNVAENGPFTSTTNTLAATLADGPLFWQVRAIDAAGNVSPWSNLQSATIDATAPLLSPNLTGGVIRGTQLVTLNITEPYLKASAIRILNPNYSSVTATPGISDQIGTMNPLSYSWNTKLVGDGTYKVQYSARDVLSHSTSELYDVVVDNTAPDVSIDMPIDGEVLNASTTLPYTIRGTVTDANPHHYFLSIARQTGPSTWTTTYAKTTNTTAELVNEAIYDWTPSEDGVYRITLSARDAAGGTANSGNKDAGSTASVIIEVDMTKPLVAATYGTTAPTNADVTVTLTATEDLDVTTLNGWLEFSPSVYTKVYTVNTTETVTFKDLAGNSGSVDILIENIDKTAPSLAVVSTTSDGNTPTITGTAEAGSKLSATFNDESYVIANTNGNWTFTSPTALENGTYAFVITATDAAENGRTESRNVVVAVTPTPATSESTDGEPTTAPTNTAPASVFAPAFTSPAAAAVLGTTDQTPETGVEGISDEKVAAAVNSEANQGTIFGIAWFWWILIIAGLSALAWFIIGAIRRRNEANS